MAGPCLREGAELELSKPQSIHCGDRGGGVTLSVASGVLSVRVEREASGDDMVACFRQALDQGLVQPAGMPTLVDLTGFNGVVDWPAVVKIKGMASWASGGQPRVAYVGLDSMLGMLVKVVATLFPHAHHRLFSSEVEALAWLRSAPRNEPPPAD